MREGMKKIDKLKNTLYNIFDKERNCSNCKYLKERLSLASRILATKAGIVPTHTIKICSLTNTTIDDRVVNSKNCVRFKRKYGSASARRKIRNFVRYSKRQWKLHHTIISLIVAIILGLIAILIAKGLL